LALTARKSTRLEDPGAEMLARGTELWDRHGRVALGVIAAVVVVAAIAWLAVRSRAAAEEQAAGQLAEANYLYWQGDYARSLDKARQVSQQYPATPSGIDAHRLAGDDAYWTGDFKNALSEYRAYLERQKSGLLADAVRRSVAYALESGKQYVEAATSYEALVGKFDRESSAEFLAAAARCYRAASRPADATKRLQRLLDEFGETSLAAEARIQLAELAAKH